MANSTRATAPAAEKSSPCIARQPILNAAETVIGYELLFREDREESQFVADLAGSCKTVDNLNAIGLDILCDGTTAFVNCEHQMLLKEYFFLLSPAEVVIEIQKSVPPAPDVIAACQKLKQAGYSICLDGFVPGDLREALIPYAKFIKVDVRQVPPAGSGSIAKQFGSRCHMLAHKVGTRDSFITAQKNGFTHFQGYFFRQPQQMRARQIPASQATYLRLLQEISKPEWDFNEIEELIKREPSLCHRLLRYLNSLLLGQASPVLSVRHGLTLLGEREVRRWIRMATTLVMGQDRPSDLLCSSLVRARFCELIGAKVPHGESDLFLLGMLSLMDSILEVPIGLVVENLSLDSVTREQLLSGKTGGTTILSPIYDLMVARELGDWEKVTSLGKQLNLSLFFMNKSYNEAMRWSHGITSDK
jgi:EAL and modified HD-GYP domain-containing signal transduction protein